MPPPDSLQRLIQRTYTTATLGAVMDRLRAEGTLQITPLPTGVFSAAATSEFSAGTNYHSVWVRDNVHIAYAHHTNGETSKAVAATLGMAKFFATQSAKFDAIITNPAIKEDVMQRPHMRFDGNAGRPIMQQWAHAQNDALGGFLWLYATLAIDAALPWSEWDCDLVGRFVNYFRAIRYWEDEDSGHWEETRKVSASSIGLVVAGLKRLRDWVARATTLTIDDAGFYIFSDRPAVRLRRAADFGAGLDALIARGEESMMRILPAECVQPEPAKARRYDAALLFLVYPFDVVNDEMAEMIVHQTREHLQGLVGIRRYSRDSFYCTDYERKMRDLGDDPTRDFSHDLVVRDALFHTGDQEAQWCIFDPILSIYYGQRFQQHGRAGDLLKETEYLNRSLQQITHDDPPRCRAFQCAELYYKECGRLQTSKSVPLLWTQANLWSALRCMQRSLNAGKPGERSGT